jgi:prepilin-type N-terminal cleavage/methylation domain-containing protein
MRRTLKSYLPACCRRAFTLIEVVASLMLMGSLLVGILVAHRRHAEQIRRADQRIMAAKLADRILSKWSSDGSWGGGKTEGRIDGTDEFTWRWRVESDSQLSRVGAAIGRLEIVDDQGNSYAQVELLTFDTLTR